MLDQAIESAASPDAGATKNGHTLAAWAHEMLCDADSSLATPVGRWAPVATASGLFRASSQPSRGLASSTGSARGEETAVAALAGVRLGDNF